MKTEYKRDMNHNYLVFSDIDIDTTAYQIRMLISNVMPNLLKTRIQMMNGEQYIYYDITSKQSLYSIYDEKKFYLEDLQLVLGSIIRVMEIASEYLMNQKNIVLDPEFLFLDAERKQVYFCYVPNYQTDIRQKLQMLMEYILPLIDHADENAVSIGYGVYRIVLDEVLQLESIQNELYKISNSVVDSEKHLMLEDQMEPFPQPTEQCGEKQGDTITDSNDFFEFAEIDGKENKLKKEGFSQITNLKRFSGWLLCGLAGIMIFVISLLCYFGYLPYLSTISLVGGIVVLTGIAMLITVIKKKWHAQIAFVDNKRMPVCNQEDKRINSENECHNNEKTEKDPEETIILGRNIPMYGGEETIVLSSGLVKGPSALVSKEAGEFATIYLKEDITLIGKMESAVDALIDLQTVSRIHAKIRKRDGEYYITDLNSKNGTVQNGRMLKGGEEYLLKDEDEIEFAQARYVFLK